MISPLGKDQGSRFRPINKCSPRVSGKKTDAAAIVVVLVDCCCAQQQQLSKLFLVHRWVEKSLTTTDDKVFLLYLSSSAFLYHHMVADEIFFAISVFFCWSNIAASCHIQNIVIFRPNAGSSHLLDFSSSDDPDHPWPCWLACLLQHISCNERKQLLARN